MTVEDEVRTALAVSGCRFPGILVPVVSERLGVLVDELCGSRRVVAVDAEGRPRWGPRGLVTAADVVRELRGEDPMIERAGWGQN